MISVALDEGISTHRSRNLPGDILVDQMQTFSLMRRPRVSDIVTIKEMFYSLIAKADSNQRRKISNALGQNSYVPRQLALFMALQPIEIATPVLLCSPVLGERDFLAVLNKCDKSHAYIIARRYDLSVRVINRLLSLDDNTCSLEKILRKNESAREKFKRASMPNITPTTASVSHLQKARQATKAVEKIYNRNEDLLKVARIGKEKKAPTRQNDPDRQTFKPAAFGQRLIALLHESNHDGFADEIKVACGLNRKLVTQYVAEANAGTLASLLFLLRVPHYTSARVLLLICPKVGRDHSVFIRIMKEFSKLDRTAAIAFFRAKDSNFALPAKRHHIIEAKPMFNALRRSGERAASTKVQNSQRDVRRLLAG